MRAGCSAAWPCARPSRAAVARSPCRTASPTEMSRDLCVARSRIATVANGVRHRRARTIDAPRRAAPRARRRLLGLGRQSVSGQGPPSSDRRARPACARASTLHVAISGRGDLRDALAAQARDLRTRRASPPARPALGHPGGSGRRRHLRSSVALGRTAACAARSDVRRASRSSRATSGRSGRRSGAAMPACWWKRRRPPALAAALDRLLTDPTTRAVARRTRPASVRRTSTTCRRWWPATSSIYRNSSRDHLRRSRTDGSGANEAH